MVWRNNADVAEKYVHKGSQIYIEGKLRTRQWTDQSGNKRYTTEVVADTLQLLGKRPEGEGGAQGGYQGGYAAQPQGQPQASAPATQPGLAAQPVNPAYQGPLPAAEPTDDLPF